MLPPMAGSGGTGDAESRALRWIAVRTKQLAQASAEVSAGRQLSREATKCWYSIAEKLRSPPPEVKAFLGGCSAEWKRRFDTIMRHQLGGDEAGQMAIWAAQAEELATEKVKGLSKENARRFRSWINQQLKKGAGAIGCDHFWPKWFGWLSDQAYLAVAALMSAIEATGIWPQSLAAS